MKRSEINNTIKFSLAFLTKLLANSVCELLTIAILKLVESLLKTDPKTNRKISGKRKVKNSAILSRTKRFC